eukprot:COSAG02_NODE_12614_length_1519_cov_1.082394_1_plen_110_part_00
MHVYMTNHLDMLPDDIYQVIYRHVNQIAIQQAASVGARRNRFGTKIPNRRTMDSVIYHWLRDKKEKASSLWTDGQTIYSYEMPIGYTSQDGRKVIRDHTAQGLGFVSVG